MNDQKPRMMTIQQIAKTGLFTQNALRVMLRQGKLPAVYIGRKALINYDKLCEMLHDLPLHDNSHDS